MTAIGPDFRQSWLWRQAFRTRRPDSNPEEQEYFRTHYLSTRERAAQLVSRISADMPDLTVHDITHLDALWETASLLAEGAVEVNPAEAFVFGASILMHDAAMSIAAYPGGLPELKNTLAWKDTVARLALSYEEQGKASFDIQDPPTTILHQVLPSVLRRLHAQHAEELADQAWRTADGSSEHLIADSDLRKFYGSTIGKIAHSHWWPVHRLELEFSENLGALPSRTNNRVDRLLLACLLRLADALHLDSRRAPRFLRALTKPTGISAVHWAFQERLAKPHIELDAIVFTNGEDFSRQDAEAWWLAYDTLNAVDRELRDVDLLLQGHERGSLNARLVKGAGSPELLSRTVQTRGWRPINTKLQVSDVPRIVDTLGGSKLYGDSPTVPLRELIQNAADAIQARRKFEDRPNDWGTITVDLLSEADEWWLVVEDNGIGMSEHVLTGPLLDFGTSFWRSPLAMEEFPGLMAAGMNPIGRFGIGFFSVFMLGSVVRVYSQRCDKGRDSGRLLEFVDGTDARPILSPISDKPLPIDGGTRIEVKLKNNPRDSDGILYVDSYWDDTISLEALIGSLAPNLDIEIVIGFGNDLRPITKSGDWLKMGESDFLKRLNPTSELTKSNVARSDASLMRLITDVSGVVYGRAFIWPEHNFFPRENGWISISRFASISTAEHKRCIAR